MTVLTIKLNTRDSLRKHTWLPFMPSFKLLIALILAAGASHAASAAPADKQTILGYADLPYEPELRQRIAPLLPSGQYAFSFKQHKYNVNGAGQNRLATGVWFASPAEGKILVNSLALDWASNNATIGGPLSSGYASSLFDFSSSSNGTVRNYFQMDGKTCTVEDLPVAAAQAQLFPPDLLRTTGTFVGVEHVPPYGQAEKWAIFPAPNLVVTFYFVTRPDGSKQWIRYDQYSQGLQTTVVTDVFNLRAGEGIEFEKGLLTPCRPSKAKRF